MKAAILSVLLATGVGLMPAAAREAPGNGDLPASGAASSAINSSQDEEAAALKEVIVTAQKFPQRAFEVPMSLAAIGGPELQRSLVRSLDDLEFVVPGLTVVDNGPNSRIDIRGVSNVFGQGALVGSYLDEADVTALSGLAINLYSYDLQRVEVLRGPQGTLYGEGSIGGTIRYITNKPDLNRTEISMDATALFDEYGAPSQQIVAVANAPIAPKNLGLRVAADIEHDGGWVDQPAANQKNINSRDIADARIEGLWKIGGNFSVSGTQVIHRGTTGPFTGEDAQGNYTQVFNLATTPGIEDHYDVSNVTLEWDGEQAQLVNSATHFRHNLEEKNYGFTFQLTPPPTPRFDEYVPAVRTLDEDWSDELRLSSSAGRSLHWIVGSFYRVFSEGYLPYSYYFALPGVPGSPLPSPYGPISQSSHSKSWSAFGDVSYQVLGRLSIGAGARYFRDEERLLASGVAQAQTGTYTSTDPRFYIRYGLSGNVNVYASAAKGFRSGGFNQLGAPPYQPENVWTYELGAKMRLAEYGVSTDADVFWSDYGDYQIIGLPPLPAQQLNITRNAGTARIKGVEASLRWSPTSAWKIGLDGDYIDGRFVKIDVLSSAYNVGDPLDIVPRYQLTASGERDFTWYGRAAFTRLEYSQIAREPFRNRSIGPWYYSQSDYIYMLNFNASIQWTADARIGAFVQNLLNNRGFTGPFVIETNATRERPRTFGVELSVNVR